jgi:hypothetical protein
MSPRFADDFHARPVWAGFVLFGALNPPLLIGVALLHDTPVGAWPGLAFLGAVVAVAVLMS